MTQPLTPPSPKVSDVFIIGGGINGAGIARDFAGRGLSVTLAEANDLASGTSSASTKLFHGGLRYLEFFEFDLVAKALKEREVLLSAMPHIAAPMRFVLPLSSKMRFDTATPASKILSILMPWAKGQRPAWVIRFGLFLYDRLGGRQILPPTRRIDLTKDIAGQALRPEFRRAYEYSDCTVQDARLVVLNAVDAEKMGAKILTRTKVVSAERSGDLWQIQTQTPAGDVSTFQARSLVNAAGPWVQDVIQNIAHRESEESIRLVRGSHIITRSLFAHKRSYFFQGEDGRIIFAIPYEGDFTLIGTTDVDHRSPQETPLCDQAEREYLIKFASRYFRHQIQSQDIVHSFSGLRPLYDDGKKSATAATRDYVLSLDKGDEQGGNAPLMNIFGGKITTYRKLAEDAFEALRPFLPKARADWTAGVPLPGGNFPHDGHEVLVGELCAYHNWLQPEHAARLVRTYGTLARELLEGLTGPAGLGLHFGAGLYELEVRWLMEKEFAQTAEDMVWRRTKLGLKMTQAEIDLLQGFLNAQKVAD